MLEHRFSASVGEDWESMVQRLARAANELCPPRLQGSPWLDQCVRDSVMQFQASHVTAFVPLLAWRQVRCCIRAGSCDCGEC